MYYEPEQLIDINNKLLARIDELLGVFGIEDYRQTRNNIQMPCPIHRGDNNHALCINLQKGRVVCYTRQCMKTFQPTLIGLVRGLLSAKNGWSDQKDSDKVVSFQKTIQFVENFLNEKIDQKELSDEDRELTTYNRCIQSISSEFPKNVKRFPRDVALERLSIPSDYYLNKRGYSREILVKYDVGDCLTYGRKLNGRAVFPVYDLDGMVVGATGRSIYDECEICKAYHNPYTICPLPEFRPIYSKWKHSDNFPREYVLYNLNFAKWFIENSATAILVESPGNVLRLEEAGIHNSVCLFGAALTPYQKGLLDKSGALNLIVIMDDDKAGETASKQIFEMCGLTYNICFIKPTKNDIGDMSIDEVKTLLSGFIK